MVQREGSCGPVKTFHGPVLKENEQQSSEALAELGKTNFINTSGNVPEPITAMMKLAPEIFAGYVHLREAIYRSPDAGGHLDMKTKELTYALLHIVTENMEGAKNHGRAAYNSGMRSADLAEACMIAVDVCGISPSGTVGYKVVQYIVDLASGKSASSGPPQ